MPPQPITRIIPNPTVDFDPSKLATIPHLTALPMAVIAIWGAIDGNLAKMLSHILSNAEKTADANDCRRDNPASDFAIVVAMLHALKSQEAQHSAILGAAEKALSLDDYLLLKAVWKVTRASRDRRHEYAHHLWGIPNIPEAIALLDPRDGLNELVAFEKRMEEYIIYMDQIRNSDTVNVYYNTSYPQPLPPAAPSENTDYSNVKCFRKQDLEQDLREAEQALRWFLDLQRALFGPSLQAKAEARQRLLAAPQIAQALQPRCKEKCDSPPE
jgi:hypothetical protein